MISPLAEKGVINGKAADIWALGVTLYSLVHGYCPFEDDNIVELYEKIQRDRPVYKETISHLLKDLLDAMLNKNSLKRISLEKLKAHPWVEGGGLGPLPSKEENCFEEAATISKEEIEQVFKPATFVHKASLTYFPLVSHFCLLDDAFALGWNAESKSQDWLI